MPDNWLRPCRASGCPALTHGTYCDAHMGEAKTQAQAQVKAHDKARGTAARRGYGPRWQKARLAWLARHPLCGDARPDAVLPDVWSCRTRGMVTPGVDVDHIVPHRGDMGLFWSAKNWRTLCRHCHSVKTASEDGGFGNREMERRAG